AALEAERRRGGVATAERPEERDPTPSSRRLEPVRPRGEDPRASKRRSPWRRRALVTLAVLAFLVVPVGIGLLTAVRAVYFIGSDDQGYVTVYRGVPWELPLGLDLYQTNYTSGVHRQVVPDQREDKLFDHSLRSRDDAYEVVADLERGRIEE
ncbi:MAG TPA: hypothetical protein VF587_20855, partial [Solirubrobacteraceae bacterium]